MKHVFFCMLVFMSLPIFADRLEKELGDDYRKNIVATTDKASGVLRQLSDQEGYKTFVVPDDVGGRFSVFSAAFLPPRYISLPNRDSACPKRRKTVSRSNGCAAYQSKNTQQK